MEETLLEYTETSIEYISFVDEFIFMLMRDVNNKYLVKCKLDDFDNKELIIIDKDIINNLHYVNIINGVNIHDKYALFFNIMENGNLKPCTTNINNLNSINKIGDDSIYNIHIFDYNFERYVIGLIYDEENEVNNLVIKDEFNTSIINTIATDIHQYDFYIIGNILKVRLYTIRNNLVKIVELDLYKIGSRIEFKKVSDNTYYFNYNINDIKLYKDKFYILTPGWYGNKVITKGINAFRNSI